MPASRMRQSSRARFPTSTCSIPTCPRSRVLEQRAKRAEAAALAVKGVSKSGGASASAGIGGMVLVTSHGFRGAYLSSGQSVSALAIAGEGTAMERDYDYPRRSMAPTSMRPSGSAATPANARWRGSTRARSRPSKVPVVFDRRVAGSLVGHLAGAINGSAVARKTSFLKDKLGARLFKPGIRIIDDPLRQRGLRSRPFDAEGVTARPLALIEDGVLASWLLDCATARELGLATTGHAQRGVSSAPSPASEQPASRRPAASRRQR